MLKKSIVLAFFLSSSSLSFAKNIDSILTVAPYNPSDWGYINATVSVNHSASMVGGGITLPISVGDTVSLTDVAAMNVHPRIDDSCRYIQIHEEGTRKLLFELKGDWLIHCQYS